MLGRRGFSWWETLRRDAVAVTAPCGECAETHETISSESLKLTACELCLHKVIFKNISADGGFHLGPKYHVIKGPKHENFK